MKTEIDRIRNLISDDMLVDAVELPANHQKKSHLVEDIEDVLSKFDDDADYAHFVVRVKRNNKNLSLTKSVPEQNKNESDDLFLENTSLSIDALVSETLDISQKITVEREKIENENPEEYEPSYLLENAKVLNENNETALARNIYKSLIKKGTHIPICLAGVAKSFEKENKFNEAIKCYEEAIAYAPEVQFYQSLIALLIKANRDEACCEVLSRALMLPHLNDQQKFDFHKSLGNCYTRLNQHDKAETHYLHAYDLNSDSDILQVNVGTLALHKNDYNSAKNHFERALELNMRNDNAISGLGMIHLMKGNLSEAQKQFVAALAINPDNLGAIFNLVKIAYETKSFNDAAYFLRNYISNHEPNINILYSYSGVLYHQGEHALAQKEVERILNLNPNHAGAKELQELLIKNS